MTFNYALAFLSNAVSMAISVQSMNRFGTNAAAYLEAIKVWPVPPLIQLAPF